jgi:hypothetical protein
MSGEGFAFFCWRVHTLRVHTLRQLTREKMHRSHGWQCFICRDLWIKLQARYTKTLWPYSSSP